MIDTEGIKADIVGKRIRERMNAMGMTRVELAEKVGVTQATMSRYASGKRMPKAYLISDMAKVLRTTPEFLLGNDVTEDSEQIYNRVLRNIIRYGKDWSIEMKCGLIHNILAKMEKKDDD